jgi:small-conductance mechanosensitive channel
VDDHILQNGVEELQYLMVRTENRIRGPTMEPYQAAIFNAFVFVVTFIVVTLFATILTTTPLAGMGVGLVVATFASGAAHLRVKADGSWTLRRGR